MGRACFGGGSKEKEGAVGCDESHCRKGGAYFPGARHLSVKRYIEIFMANLGLKWQLATTGFRQVLWLFVKRLGIISLNHGGYIAKKLSFKFKGHKV